MKQTYTIVSVFVVGIVLVAGFGYYWASRSLARKDSEISSLRQSLAEKDNMIDSLQKQNENTVEFMEEYLRGEYKIGDAVANGATAEEDYDWGSYFYDYDNFGGADEYWTYAMTYYSYASQEYRDSKAFFDGAGNYAPSEDYRTLVSLYAALADSGAKLMDYMYEASEYFATAARYYSQGKRDQGDSQLSIGNERVSAHDNEVTTYNSLLAQINSIIEML